VAKSIERFGSGRRAAVRHRGTKNLLSQSYLKFFQNCRRNLTMPSWEGKDASGQVHRER
jgi:hypothetical protein